MSVFGQYARYYDLLYRDKDYEAEAQFIRTVLQTYAPEAQQLLELGCGTGAHAVLLAEQGYQVHGIDLSEEMLQRADSRLTQLPPDLTSRLKFTQGDLRNVRLNQTFDVVLSLFHVMSYQTTNEDLSAALATVKDHLKPGGIFVFDVWYGPAVLSDRPQVRVKHLEDDQISVTRIAEPILYPNKNWVDVNYQIFITDKQTTSVNELRETHRMRYWFNPEIESLVQQFGLKILKCREWMSDREAGFDTWGTYFIAQYQEV
jgi:SAM-dependent methyltransferase